MAVRRGTATPSKVYRGTVPVKKVMRGTVEVWSASPYPLTGTWGMDLVAGGRREVATHTIAEAGSYILRLSSSPSATTHFIYRNGGSTGNGGTNPWQVERACEVGDLISFRVLVPTNGNYTGTYSITKT